MYKSLSKLGRFMIVTISSFLLLFSYLILFRWIWSILRDFPTWRIGRWLFQIYNTPTYIFFKFIFLLTFPEKDKNNFSTIFCFCRIVLCILIIFCIYGVQKCADVHFIFSYIVYEYFYVFFSDNYREVLIHL